MKRNLNFSIVLILLSFEIIAQIPKAPINLQSPNAASFGQITEMKTNFTGSLPVQFPIFDIADGPISDPISINYNTSGIRPDAHTGWLGLNMDFNIGGSIVRTVRDSPDDNHLGVPNGTDIPIYTPGFLFAGNLLNTEEWKTENKVADFSFNNFDSEPDDFAFKGPNLSGKFFFGSDGKIKIQSDQNLKIDFIGSTNGTFPPFEPPNFIGNIWYSNSQNPKKYMGHWAGFIITDENGTKYEFGGDNSFVEYSMNFFDQGKDTWVCNSWHLKSITAHTGQKINYIYERGEFIAQMAVTVSNIENVTAGTQWFNQSCYNNTNGLSQQGIYNGKLISPIYLKEVNTANTKVEIISSESTELKYDENIFTTRSTFESDQGKSYKDIFAYLMDCYHFGQPFSEICNFTTLSDILNKLKWRKIDKIRVTNTYDSIVQKEFDFTYDNTATQRLRLQKIQEIGSNLTDKINPYEFSYNAYFLKQLPNYCKSHTDHWGFNNGKTIALSDFSNSNFATYGDTYRSPATGADTINYFIGMLSKVKYPTGGFTEFSYQLNRFANEVKINRNFGYEAAPSNNEIAGGTRIWKTKTYEQNTNCPPIEKEYLYLKGFDPKNPTTSKPSSGILGGKNQYYWTDYHPVSQDLNYNSTEKVFSTQSVLPSSENGMDSHIGYSEIIEKTSTGGWAVYKFSNYDNGSPANQYWDEAFEVSLQPTATAYEPFNSKAFTRGKLIENSAYNQAGDPILKSNLVYSHLGSDYARAIRTNKKILCNTTFYILEGTAYKIYTNQYKLTQETKEIFNQTNVAQSVITTTNYGYNIYGQVNLIRKSQSDGSELIARTKYVPEYEDNTSVNCNSALADCLALCGSNGACQGQCYATYNACLVPIDDASLAIVNLKNRHIWWAIETITYRKRNGVEQIIGGNISVPGYFGGRSMPYKGYKLHLNTPLASNTVTFSQINSARNFAFNTLYKQPEITFDSYNNESNPTQFTARNGLITSYVWGYRNRLPIAEIKNATYASISTALGSDENLLLTSVVSEADIRTKINELRTSNARKITTYTHDVIFGIKSITNPTNINTYYFYDGLGKLKTTKDHYGKILNDIVYQYANQAAQTGIGATPTNMLNYILTRTPRTEQDNISSNIDETTTTIGYVDGIGRPVQSLIWKGSPDKTKDIISNTVLFDDAGRNHKTILPTRSDGPLGQYKIGAEILAKTFYSDTVARNETFFEASPLSRLSQQFGAGQIWHEGTPKPQKFFHETTGTESIPLYTADENGIIKGTASYPNDQLFMTRVQDEKENEMIEIKDTDGKTIQKRIIDDGGVLLITHFVYNDLNQLKGVIQPNAYPLLGNLAKTEDNSFFYNYDIRGRIIEKKVPASDLEYFVYDKWDRLVLSQNPLQQAVNKWGFYKYDVLNREIMRGEKVYSNSDTQVSLQLLAEANNIRKDTLNSISPIYYSLNKSFPEINYLQNNPNSDYIYQINYYDNYLYWAAGLDYVLNETPHDTLTLNGSLTGTKILGKPKLNNNNWLRTVNYYDFKNRLIQNQKEHLLSTDANICSYEYNFVGELLKKKTTHKKTGKSALIELVVNTLDHIGRLKFIDHSIANITKRIAVYEYDDIGRMITKNLGTLANFTGSNSRQSVADGNWNTDATWNNFQIPGANSLVEINHNIVIPTSENAFAGNIIFNSGTITPNGTLTLGGAGVTGTPLQKIDYQHHIRGGLIGINLDMAQGIALNITEKDFFSYKLEYDFDYNIKKQSWRHEGINENKSYDFTYDKSHRLQTALYLPAGQEISITNLDYDKNGNISKLQRDGKKGAGYGEIDELTYDYTGNRLTHMTEDEAGNHDVDFMPRGNQNYTYYNDGSLKSDDNEDITEILYDTFLRQPTQMTLTENRKIDYIYSGAGELLQTDYSGTITEKWNNVENLIYKGLEYYSLNTAEGRVNYTNSNWEFEYFITDHLGNVRVSFKDNGSGAATKTAITDRDPFGVILRNTQTVNGAQNRNEFQGKSSELTFGLNRIDFGARSINPTIGRMDRVDPMSENLHNLSLSTYSFTANNPINNIDPDGKDWYTNNETGNYTWYKGKEERDGFKHVGGKNSVLGEFEEKINGLLKNTFGIKGGLYSEGFTFNVVDKNKGGFLPVDGKGGGNFLDEFINNKGPEFSIFKSDHPYTQEMMTESVVKESQNLIREGKTDVSGERTKIRTSFGPLGYLTSFSIAEQFIGKYRLDVFTSSDGSSYNNIISDTKSRSSLYYNRDVENLNRNQTGTMGTTYQFYIWKSPTQKK